MPRVRALAASGRFEPRPIIPKGAWLEGVVNAVPHRSYSLGGDHTRVELFPDRIETATDLGPGALRILDLMRSAREPLRTGEVETLAGITRPTALRSLRALRDAGLITWEGESARDPQARWLLA